MVQSINFLNYECPLFGQYGCQVSSFQFFQNDEETQKANPRQLMQHQNSYRDVVLKLNGELGVGQEK